VLRLAGGRAGAQPVERYVPPPPPTSEADIFGEAVTRGENFGKYHRTQARCTPEGKIVAPFQSFFIPPVLFEGRVKPIELYEEANLGTQVLSNIRRAHFEEPTPIQRYALPCIQQRDDLTACAQTGSGKTVCDNLSVFEHWYSTMIVGRFSLTHHFESVGIPRRRTVRTM
jgi:hypothetical protein